MIGSILKWVTGGGLSGITAQLRGAYQDKLNATNDADRINAEIKIAQLEARQGVLVSGGKMTAMVQFLWAAPFIIYNAKLIVWDKVLGLGATDPLSPALYDVQTIIVGFFFLTAGLRSLKR